MVRPEPKSGPLDLVVTCSRGLEEVTTSELEGLGFRPLETARGSVCCTGSLEGLYRANLWLRSATRVLVRLARGRAGSRDALYRTSSAVPWEDLVGRGQTIVVDVAGRGEAFTNTFFAAQVVKDAVVDRLRRLTGERPSVATDADVRIHLHLDGDTADLSVDSSGEPLAHRGYRPRGGPAPLQESLAAGLLLLAGYDGSQPLLDPMCGTGTIAIEGALIATRTPPGGRRRFAFERWSTHDPALWRRLLADATRESRVAPAPIVARDRDPRAVEATSRNARAAGVMKAIRVEAGELGLVPVQPRGTLLVTNPPYGERLGRGSDLEALYRQLGDTFKRALPDGVAHVLAGNPELAKLIGLRATRRVVVFNGPIECRLLRFEVWQGSRAGGERRPDGGATLPGP